MTDLFNDVICTGCSACASICKNNCISMIADENGFRYPQIDETTCVSCNLCQNVCPVLHKPDISSAETAAYAVYSKNEELRLDSSSGGVFSELAQEVLRKNGTVYGAIYDDVFQVKHVCVESEDKLGRLRGAKYAQSDMGGSFRDVLDKLEEGYQVLFSGTPCQVAGLKAFLQRDYENLICVDFVCHGVPSPMAWNEYVKARALVDNGGILPQTINLRSKSTGWSRYQYSNEFDYSDGTVFSSKSGDNLFMKLFVGDYISRKSCGDCQFKGYQRVSDITIGDFWGIWDIAPEMDDDKGTSVVLVQSEAGKKIFLQIQENVVVKEVTLEEASQQNPCMIKTASEKENRNEVLDAIRQRRILELNEIFNKPKETFLNKLYRKIRNKR